MNLNARFSRLRDLSANAHCILLTDVAGVTAPR
jgi:hypothetical protein